MEGIKHIRILVLTGFVFANLELVKAQTEVSEKAESRLQPATQPIQRITSGEEVNQADAAQQTTTVHSAVTLSSSKKPAQNQKTERIGSEEKNDSTQISGENKPAMRRHAITKASTKVRSTEAPRRVIIQTIEIEKNHEE